jgi:hypothetical protein
VAAPAAAGGRVDGEVVPGVRPATAPKPAEEQQALLAVDGEVGVDDGALGELLLAGRVDPLAVVGDLPLTGAELECVGRLQGEAQVEQSRGHEVELEVVDEPGAVRVPTHLEAGAVDGELPLARLGVRDEAPLTEVRLGEAELGPPVDVGVVVPVPAADVEALRSPLDRLEGVVLLLRGRLVRGA